MLNYVLHYFGLTLIAIELVGLYPFNKANIEKIIQLGGLLLFHLWLIFLASPLGIGKSLPILGLTLIFTMGSRVLKEILKKNIVLSFMKPTILVEIIHYLDWDKESMAFINLKKMFLALKQRDIETGRGIFLQFMGDKDLQKIQDWNTNLLRLLIFSNSMEWADQYTATIKPDFTKGGLKAPYLLTLSQVYTMIEEWEQALKTLKYMEHYYNQPPYHYLILSAYLFLYTYSGCEDSFYKLLNQYPGLNQTPGLDYYRGMVHLKAGNIEKACECLDELEKQLTPQTEHLKSFIWEMRTEPDKFKIQDDTGLWKVDEAFPSIIKSEKDSLFPVVKSKPVVVFILMGLIGLITITQFILSVGSDFMAIFQTRGGLAADFLKSGALTTIDGPNHQWVRLVTSIFLHAGWFHLFVNLYSLFNLGRITEKIYGPWMFLFIFLFSGIGGNLASLGIEDFSIGVGASGGVFGLLGAFFVFILIKRKSFPPGQFSRTFVNFAVVIGINIMLGFQIEQINNTAHIAGMLVGMFLGGVFSLINSKAPVFKTIVSRISLLLVIVTMAWTFISWPGLYKHSYTLENEWKSMQDLNGLKVPMAEGWEYRDGPEEKSFIYHTSMNSIISGQLFPAVGMIPILKNQAINELKIYEKIFEKEYRGWFYMRFETKPGNPENFDVINVYFKELKEEIRTIRITTFSLKRFAEELENQIMPGFLEKLEIK